MTFPPFSDRSFKCSEGENTESSYCEINEGETLPLFLELENYENYAASRYFLDTVLYNSGLSKQTNIYQPGMTSWTRQHFRSRRHDIYNQSTQIYVYV